MGSKNRIYLGFLTKILSHFIRNISNKEIFMTDKIVKKISEKHSPLDKEYILNKNFQIVIDNTIALYYDDEKLSYNCLSKVDNKFLIYGLVVKNIHIEVKTLFKSNPNQIKNKFGKNKNLRIMKEDEFNNI